LWRRRESNGGPVVFAEDVGAIRSVDSHDKTGDCGDAGETASAPEYGGERGTCSNVASPPTLAAVLEMVDAVVAALDAGEIDVARARLRTLRAAVRATCHVADEHGVLGRMRHQGINRYFGIEAALRDLVRDVVRGELGYLRDEILGWMRAHEPPAFPTKESSSDELLTAVQVADSLQVVPGTVRSWIKSGALKSSRPRNGMQPGRTYRVRRADVDAFVAASEGGLRRAVARPTRRLAPVREAPIAIVRAER
jgi:excisionase family DNA binding protein